MNLLILGAGASYATHELPIAYKALTEWEQTIHNKYKILALALDFWLGSTWKNQHLEIAWTQIDVAWKERVAAASQYEIRDLDTTQKRKVWELAFQAEKTEQSEPNYYRTQTAWTRDQCWSTEQFLSIVAGWELRRLIQEKFNVPLNSASAAPYQELINRLNPDTIISFNYDTLMEQYLKQIGRRFRYEPVLGDPNCISVLKPHGSVNWTHWSRGDSYFVDKYTLDFTLSPENMGYKGNWLLQNLVIGLRNKIEHTSAERSPVIRGLFRDVLEACEQSLKDANEISVAGYSFAAADTGFLDVLARSLAQRTIMPLLRVIDKDESQKFLPRIRDLFRLDSGKQIPHCLHGFKEWASHSFCNSET